VTAGTVRADNGHADESRHDGPWAKCAKACALCTIECNSCYQHCTGLVAAGHKDHAKAMRLCIDCAGFCATAAELTARHSALAILACEACAKACDMCAEECQRFPEDKHMAACAKSCRECAADCREMIKHAVK